MEAAYLVWLKCDLRTQDHPTPFAAEEDDMAYRVMYIFETFILTHPETSDRYLKFIHRSLDEVNKQQMNYSLLMGA